MRPMTRRPSLCRTLNIADDFSGQIDDMISGFNEMGYSPSTIKQFKRMVDDKVLGRIGDSGELSAEGLKRLDSELGKLTSKGAPEMREMAGQLKRTMMDMAAEQSPEYAAQLAKADDAFKNMAVIDRAGAGLKTLRPSNWRPLSRPTTRRRVRTPLHRAGVQCVTCRRLAQTS